MAEMASSPRGIAVCAPSQAAINADVAEAPGNESSVLTENADAALNTLAAGTVEGVNGLTCLTSSCTSTHMCRRCLLAR